MLALWSFTTRNFSVTYSAKQDYDYVYDGDDESGEIQDQLNAGDLIAFNSIVLVSYRGHIVGSDCLSGSVYKSEDVESFFTAHRDPDPLNRNCSVMRETRGPITICHYFPDMVRAAISEARAHFKDTPAPTLRETA